MQVFLGASAVLSNGTVMSRAGSAAVAMMAYASSKPVLICCETYKFHEKVQLDSITANELGDPEALIKVANQPDITALQDWEQQPRLGEASYVPVMCWALWFSTTELCCTQQLALCTFWHACTILFVLSHAVLF